MNNPDSQILGQAVHSLLETHWPPQTAVERSLLPDAVRALWSHMVAMGLPLLGTQNGGFGLIDALAVIEALGRAGCPAPVIDTMLANRALADQPAAGALGAQISRGEAIVSVAFGAFDGDDQAGALHIVDGAVSGRLAMIENAPLATHLLTFAEPGPTLVLLPLSGMAFQPAPGFAVPPLSAVSLSGAPALLLPIGAEHIGDLCLIARLALATRAFGAARRGFDLLIDYVQQRRQFGQPIGRFQAIQHKLANSLIGLDGARLTLTNAATFHDRNAPDWRVFAAAAIAFAGPALRQIALETQHCFGAIGYSEEHEAPRHFRRVHADLARGGGVRRAREELATYLLGPVAA